jgi:sarcosine oxidase
MVVASPCNAHGFKFSCLIGRALANLAISGEGALAIETWKGPVH